MESIKSTFKKKIITPPIDNTFDKAIDMAAKSIGFDSIDFDKIFEKPIEKPVENEIKITIRKYTDKSYVIRGDTKSIKELLKSNKCRFNPHLQGGSGWITSKSNLEVLTKVLKDYTY